MIWQDVVVAAAHIVFIFALLPSILGEHKPSPWTSLIKAIMVLLVGCTLCTLGLFFTMAVEFVLAALWFILFLQKVLPKGG